jgi:hypothetical protein
VQKIDFPEGYTTVTGIAEVPASGAAGRHSHPGIETGYVLEGEIELLVDGKSPMKLKAGDSYQIPEGAIHDAKPVISRSRCWRFTSSTRPSRWPRRPLRHPSDAAVSSLSVFSVEPASVPNALKHNNDRLADLAVRVM